MLAERAAGRVDRVLRVLALSGCADTLVGNELIRGISGGERRRLTIGETLVTNARVLLLDEISTGAVPAPARAAAAEVLLFIRSCRRALFGVASSSESLSSTRP